jgi:hypothetical protein
MKIVIASSIVPFVYGGGSFIVDWLEQKLLEYGHQVERFCLPFVERPGAFSSKFLLFVSLIFRLHATASSLYACPLM